MRASARNQRPGLFEWLQVALILVYVWRIQDIQPVLARLQVPILVSVAAFGMLFLSHRKELSLRFGHPIVRVGTFIIIWMVLSVPGSVYPGLSLRFILNDHVKTYLVMLTLVAGTRSMVDLHRLILAMVLGATLYCVAILTTFHIGSGGRLGDLFYYDANDLAMLLVCTLPFLAYLMRPDEKSRWRMIAVVLAGLFVITIVKTGSRGGFLGLIAVSFFMLFGFRAIPARVRVGAVGIAMTVLLVASGPTFWSMMGTMLHPKDDYNFNGNEAGRSAIWSRGMGYMFSRPLVGVGANAFPQAEGMLSEELTAAQAMGRGVKWSAAHNSFVQIGAELGIPGLIAFIVQLILLIRTCSTVFGPESRAGPSERALAQALVAMTIGYMVSGFFLSQAYGAYLYASSAIVVGLAFVSGNVKAQPGRQLAGGRPRQAPGRRGFPVPRPPAAAMSPNVLNAAGGMRMQSQPLDGRPNST